MEGGSKLKHTDTVGALPSLETSPRLPAAKKLSHPGVVGAVSTYNPAHRLLGSLVFRTLDIDCCNDNVQGGVSTNPRINIGQADTR